MDAYNYAASIKDGQDLFEPHHLFYNGFSLLIYKVMNLFDVHIEILALAKIVNSVFVVFNLAILTKILQKLALKKKQILIFIAIAAFSYSSLRYGTENETYIVPIAFSLLGSYFFWVVYSQNKVCLSFEWFVCRFGLPVSSNPFFLVVGPAYWYSCSH